MHHLDELLVEARRWAAEHERALTEELRLMRRRLYSLIVVYTLALRRMLINLLVLVHHFREAHFAILLLRS